MNIEQHELNRLTSACVDAEQRADAALEKARQAEATSEKLREQLAEAGKREAALRAALEPAIWQDGVSITLSIADRNAIREALAQPAVAAVGDSDEAGPVGLRRMELTQEAKAELEAMIARPEPPPVEVQPMDDWKDWPKPPPKVNALAVFYQDWERKAAKISSLEAEAAQLRQENAAMQGQISTLLQSKAAAEREAAKATHDLAGTICVISNHRARLEKMGVPLPPPGVNAKTDATIIMNAAVAAADGKIYLPYANERELRNQVKVAEAEAAQLREQLAAAERERGKSSEALDAIAVALVGSKLPFSGSYSFKRETAAESMRAIIKQLEAGFAKQQDMAAALQAEVERLNALAREYGYGQGAALQTRYEALRAAVCESPDERNNWPSLIRALRLMASGKAELEYVQAFATLALPKIEAAVAATQPAKEPT